MGFRRPATPTCKVHRNLKDTRISMDGKSRATDNIWIERFWKTIKYGYVYLNPCDNGTAGKIDLYIGYYNARTHHTFEQSPNYRYGHKTAELAA